MVAKGRLRELRSEGDDGRGLQQMQHEIAVDAGYRSWSALLSASEEDRQLTIFLSANPPTIFEPTSLRFRADRISAIVNDHEGWGAGGGTTERYEFPCPCGAGRIVEEHDNIPGFREHDRWMECARCGTRWDFVGGRSTRDWLLEPTGISLAN